MLVHFPANVMAMVSISEIIQPYRQFLSRFPRLTFELISPIS